MSGQQSEEEVPPQETGRHSPSQSDLTAEATEVSSSAAQEDLTAAEVATPSGSQAGPSVGSIPGPSVKQQRLKL